MVDFVGAGCGAKDLITLRGLKLIQQADVIIYAGSLVNPELLEYAKPGCEIHNSALMTLDEVISVMSAAESAGKRIVRLHTGEPEPLRRYPRTDEQAGRAGYQLRGLPRRKQLLRSCCGSPGGVHSPCGQPDGDNHAHGGAHSGSGARKHRIPRGARLHDGDFPQHGHAGAFRAADKRWLLHGYSRRDSLQGKLAG